MPSSVRTRTMTFARFMISRSANSMVTPASTTCTDTSVIFMACRTYHSAFRALRRRSAGAEVNLSRPEPDQLPVARVAALAPGLEVFATVLGSEVAEGDGADKLDPLCFGQRLDGCVSDHADDPVGPFARRHSQGGAAVPGQRASFICGEWRRDQHLSVPVLEPHRQHMRVPVQAVEAQLPDERAPEDVGGARIQAAILAAAVRVADQARILTLGLLARGLPCDTMQLEGGCHG